MKCSFVRTRSELADNGLINGKNKVGIVEIIGQCTGCKLVKVGLLEDDRFDKRFTAANFTYVFTDPTWQLKR